MRIIRRQVSWVHVGTAYDDVEFSFYSYTRENPHAQFNGLGLRTEHCVKNNYVYKDYITLIRMAKSAFVEQTFV